jgi:hypothetical protein
MDMDTKTYDYDKLSIWKKKSLTNEDYGKLLNLITDDIGKAYVSPYGLHTLYLLATNSKKIDSHRIPDDVVTMNSELILTTDNFQKQLVKIVFPEDIKGKHDLSVYSAIGMACLGAKEKSYVYVNQNTSVQKILIEKIIFQPEREKLFYL